jgi:dTDP-glucose 4,6-dehydratase
VFGDLMGNGSFSERSPYRPSSPYSASKAAADHLVRAWARTYDLPVVIAHCSNNYGPYQHEEKLIPTVIRRALAGEAIPVYGNGEQVRDWIYVEDCAGALVTILEKGTSGESYNEGGCNERRNIDVIHMLCAKLDALCAKENGEAYAEQIRFVTDRPGHDQRYALDCTKLRESLGWSASVDFEAGITATVRWYCAD